MTSLQSQPKERRRSLRQRALLSAKVADTDARQTIDCVIRNFSDDGVLIETESVLAVPNAFHLLHVRDGMVWDARVMWRRGRLLGLEITEKRDIRDAADRQLLALRRIWSSLTR